jgi:molybdate transport system ATP-binding protein
MADDIIHIDIEKWMVTSFGNLNLSIKIEIQPGELVALFGPSGAGKTTLLRMLAGLTKPDKGLIKCGNAVWFDAGNKINVSPQQRNISLMFQDYALFPNMTVEQNIRFAQSESDQSITHELISLFGLSGFMKRKPHSLSGGQKQRVALARALARKPGLLLLDEPLSSLDDDMRLMLQREIEQAHKLTGATTIMVSHDLQEVCRLASTVFCLGNGTVNKSGPPYQIFNLPHANVYHT